MKVEDIMSRNVIRISPDSSVEVAARTFAHYNVGVLPVCTESGRLCGLVTDRDLVTRCVAASGDPGKTKVRSVMTSQIISVEPEMDTAVAACLMGAKQVRRLPVVEKGKLCGMVSLSDVASCGENGLEAADALAVISSNVTNGGNFGEILK